MPWGAQGSSECLPILDDNIAICRKQTLNHNFFSETYLSCCGNYIRGTDNICVEVLNKVLFIEPHCVSADYVLVCRCPLGEDWTDEVAKASIKCKWIKLTPLFKEHSTIEE
jgi:hypothetical protein